MDAGRTLRFRTAEIRTLVDPLGWGRTGGVTRRCDPGGVTLATLPRWLRPSDVALVARPNDMTLAAYPDVVTLATLPRRRNPGGFAPTA